MLDRELVYEIPNPFATVVTQASAYSFDSENDQSSFWPTSNAAFPQNPAIKSAEGYFTFS